MDYQLLKINNVTKLCDDRIVQDKKGNILEENRAYIQNHSYQFCVRKS